MTTPRIMTGFEYGLATPVVNGGGLISLITGTCTIQSTIKRSGSYALKVVQSGASAYVTWTSAFGSYIVGRVYVYVKDNAPSASVNFIEGINTDANLFVGYNVSTGNFYAGLKGVAGTDGAALSVNTWYQIDFRFFTTSTTHTVEWKIDGNAQSTHSSDSRTSTSMTGVRLGMVGAATSECYFDDVDFSATSGDFPIGAGQSAGLRPIGDGTHNNAANIMEDSAGNDIGDGTGGTVAAWDKLEEDPWTSGANDYVRQTDNGTGNYCEIVFADTPSASVINGVRAILQYYSASTTANTGGCIIIDEDATETVVWGNAGALADYSESSRFYKSVQLPTPAGGWDEAAVNALKCRFGYSDDANPDPYWQAIMLEVDYVGGAAPQTVNLSTVTLAGSVPQADAQPGGVSLTMDELTLASSVPTATLQAVTTLVMQTLSLASSIPASDVQPGAVSLLMDTLELLGSVPQADAQPGAVSLTMDTLTLASSIPAMTLQAVVSIILQALTLSSSIPASDVQPGAISRTMQTLGLAGSIPALSVASGNDPQTINLLALLLAGSIPQADAQPGGVSITLDTLNLAGSAPASDVNPGAVSVLLNTLGITGSVPTGDVNPGAVSIVLNSLNLAGSMPPITISVPSAQSVTLDTLVLAAVISALLGTSLDYETSSMWWLRRRRR